MANRAFLLSLDTPYTAVPPGQEKEESIVAAASYMIPIFWHGLFAEANIAFRRAPIEDGATVEYPVFQAPRDEALARLHEFKLRVAPLFPSIPPLLFSVFATVLGATSGKWLAVETSELWMMEEPPAMEQLFRRCTRTAATIPARPRPWQFWRAPLSPEWKELLAQANVNFSARRTEPFSLFGYSWIKPVPWESKAARQP